MFALEEKIEFAQGISRTLFNLFPWIEDQWRSSPSWWQHCARWFPPRNGRYWRWYSRVLPGLSLARWTPFIFRLSFSYFWQDFLKIFGRFFWTPKAQKSLFSFGSQRLSPVRFLSFVRFVKLRSSGFLKFWGAALKRVSQFANFHLLAWGSTISQRLTSKSFPTQTFALGDGTFGTSTHDLDESNTSRNSRAVIANTCWLFSSNLASSEVLAKS